MSSPVLHEFRYRLSRLHLLFLVPLASLGFALLFYHAIYPPPRPVKIYGIEVSPAQFQVLMGIFAALVPVAIGFIIVAWNSAFAQPSRIALTADSVILPKPNGWGQAWGSDEMELRFENIHSVNVVPFVGYTVQIEIVHADGKVGIPSNMLPSRREFNLLFQLLSAAMTNAQSNVLLRRYINN